MWQSGEGAWRLGKEDEGLGVPGSRDKRGCGRAIGRERVDGLNDR